jgi:hypothetical protein
VSPGECRDSTRKLGRNRFVPNPFQFIAIHLSPYHRAKHGHSLVTKYGRKLSYQRTNQQIFQTVLTCGRTCRMTGSIRNKECTGCSHDNWPVAAVFRRAGKSIVLSRAFHRTRMMLVMVLISPSHADVWGSGRKNQSPNTPMKAHGKRMYSSYSFTTSALDCGKWSASRPGRALPPGKWPHRTHWTGGWVGPRAVMDAEVKGKILLPLPGI